MTNRKPKIEKSDDRRIYRTVMPFVFVLIFISAAVCERYNDYLFGSDNIELSQKCEKENAEKDNKKGKEKDEFLYRQGQGALTDEENPSKKQAGKDPLFRLSDHFMDISTPPPEC
ncbi:hypothetical protein FUAX_52720 (plasmid) [Fulvitalea axinellae]|uniref:Uncharacterized protein n=1 Tax=Fulvitalea axinellae TaxID=1182444 RepID=A0AAU9DJY7_9BACT|nr:hypothetical protein FUAX_52720 [Fulvitalea axinellae]